MKKSLLNHPALKQQIEKVDLPGPAIYVKTVNSSRTDEMLTLFSGEISEADAQIACCIACACDAKGNSLFTEEDKAHLQEAPINTIRTISTHAMNINGFVEVEEKIEQAAKN